MRGRLLAILVLLAVSAVAVPAALADPADDAAAVSTAFINAIAAEDGQKACGMVSSGFLAHIGGSVAACARAFSSQDMTDEQDTDARTALQEAWVSATSVAAAHAGSFPMPAARFARELNGDLDATHVVLGVGAAAAAKHRPDTLILDTKRTTKRRMVLYIESDSGQIWQLVGGTSYTHGPVVSRAAKGVPVDDPAPSITVAVKSAYLTPAGAEVTVSVSENGESSAVVIQLVKEGGVWKVSDLLVSLISGSDRRPI